MMINVQVLCFGKTTESYVNVNEIHSSRQLLCVSCEVILGQIDFCSFFRRVKFRNEIVFFASNGLYKVFFT